MHGVRLVGLHKLVKTTGLMATEVNLRIEEPSGAQLELLDVRAGRSELHPGRVPQLGTHHLREADLVAWDADQRIAPPGS